jgi:hypothetical protein
MPETFRDIYDNVMECGGHPKKDIRCHHFGQHYDMYIIYNIFYTLHSCKITLTRTLVY